MLSYQCGDNCPGYFFPKKAHHNRWTAVDKFVLFDEDFLEKQSCIIFVFSCCLSPTYMCISTPHPALLHIHPTQTGICSHEIGLAMLLLASSRGSHFPAIFVASSSISTPPFPRAPTARSPPWVNLFATTHHLSLGSDECVDNRGRDRGSANGSSDVKKCCCGSTFLFCFILLPLLQSRPGQRVAG